VYCCTLNTKGASERERSHKTPLNICFEAEKVLWKSVSMDSFFKSAAGGQYKATWFHKYFISNIKLPQVFVLRKMLFYPSRRHRSVLTILNNKIHSQSLALWMYKIISLLLLFDSAFRYLPFEWAPCSTMK